MPLRFSPVRGTAAISIASYIRGPAGADGAPGASGIITPVASQAEAEAGASNVVAMTPLRTTQWGVGRFPTQAAVAAIKGIYFLGNGKIVESRGSNAVTFAVKTILDADPSSSDPVVVLFRDGSSVTIDGAVSVTISSGSTLGTTNNGPFRLWIIGINDAGTFRLGVINCRTASGVVPINNIVSSTAEGGAGGADTAGVIYSGNAVTSKQAEILAYADYNSGLATAGAWASAPTRITLFGISSHRPGEVVQTTNIMSNAVATGTTILPHDDTIPQSGEGTQFLSGSITPMSALNVLQHFHSASYSSSVTASWISVALFQDATANALTASDAFASFTGTGGVTVSLWHEMLAGTEAATTFKIRAGINVAGTLTFNGANGSRFFGGVRYVTHTVREIMG